MPPKSTTKKAGPAKKAAPKKKAPTTIEPKMPTPTAKKVSSNKNSAAEGEAQELWALVECDKSDSAWGSCRPSCRVFTSKAAAHQALMARYQAIAENPARQPARRCHPARAKGDCAIYGHGEFGEHELHLQVQRVALEVHAGEGIDDFEE